MGDRVHALPRAKRGKMGACHRNHPDPTCQRVPDPINNQESTGPRRGPETFQGPHHPWGPEHGPQQGEEPAESASCGPPRGVRSHRPGLTLSPAP